MSRTVKAGSRTQRRYCTKRLNGKPIVRQPGKNGSSRTVSKPKRNK